MRTCLGNQQNPNSYNKLHPIDHKEKLLPYQMFLAETIVLGIGQMYQSKKVSRIQYNWPTSFSAIGSRVGNFPLLFFSGPQLLVVQVSLSSKKTEIEFPPIPQMLSHI